MKIRTLFKPIIAVWGFFCYMAWLENFRNGAKYEPRDKHRTIL